MIKVWLLALMILYNGFSSTGAGIHNNSTIPDFVNIGALFSFNTSVGIIIKIAIQAAVEDVNSDPNILGKTKLRLSLQEDSKYRGFLSISEVLQVMASHTVAIIGPHSSVTAHVITHIANELQVPLLSFSALDPTLSSLQFPFFIRTCHSDLYTMAAIADLVDYYGWKDVIAVYIDDDNGRNGIGALGDKLAERRCKISYKAPLSPEANREEITNVLVQVALAESRVIVVHANTVWGPKIFSVAKNLGMMGTGYVWIATAFLSALLEINSPLPSDTMDEIQGVLTPRIYTPDSELKRRFVSRWKNLTRGDTANGPLGVSFLSLYAYDTVYALAHALDAFFKQGNRITFSNDPKLSALHGDNLHLDALNIFDEGNLLRRNIYEVNMTGVTGTFKYTSDGSLVNPAYEIINVVGTGFRRIGYWSNYSGLSVVPPEALYSKPANKSSANQKLLPVIWPGETEQKPRGWVFPNNGRLLKIGVPKSVSYREFVSQVPGTDTFQGFCIDVFLSAVNLLPYAVPYKFISYGDGKNNPSITELVRLITTGEFDGAVGDIAITTVRTKTVDFTQPYVESGLVVVAPVRESESSALAFLAPFTPRMWLVTAIFFILVGTVVWILEHRVNDDFRGPPKKQVVTILWFSFSTMFFSHRENTVSTLGRVVLLIWLFVVLIINSSYTASLTSILTVQQLSSPIKGIESLVNSKDAIGYMQGSFAKNYLIQEIGIDATRLVPLRTPEETARALKKGPQNGGVAAYIAERAYVDIFLSTKPAPPPLTFSTSSKPQRDSLVLEEFRQRKLKGSSSSKDSNLDTTEEVVQRGLNNESECEPTPTMVVANFKELGVSEELVAVMEGIGGGGGFVPSEIQCVVIPAILEGKSLLFSSPPQPDRTLAYLLPLIQLLRRDGELLSSNSKHPRAVVLCASEEKAAQCFNAAGYITHNAKLKSAKNCSSSDNEKSIGLMIGTPCEILQYVEEGIVVPAELKYLVLDEADFMLGSGLGPEIHKIITPLQHHDSKSTVKRLQTILAISTITEVLGEESPLVKGLEHDHAGNISAMSLEIEETEVLHFTESMDALRKKLAEAMDSLLNQQQ